MIPSTNLITYEFPNICVRKHLVQKGSCKCLKDYKQFKGMLKKIRKKLGRIIRKLYMTQWKSYCCLNHFMIPLSCQSHTTGKTSAMYYRSSEQRTMWNSNSNSPLIPWSVNLFLRYKSSIFCNVHLKWYISHSFKGWRRFMLWALTKIRSILRPYISDFLLTTTSFNPSWIIMNEMGVSSHKGSIQVIQAWNFVVYISRDSFVYLLAWGIFM